jgi:enoyl-CoA hydratase/carnithine racemase
VQHYIDKPLVAAVNGFALGGGTEIVLACDLAVISSEATLGLPEVTRGLIAGAGGLLRLPDHMPPKLAAAAILTGDPITPSDALQWGLVNAVVEPDDVLSVALQMAEKVAANAPLAVTASKRIMARRRDFGSDWNDAMWSMNDRTCRDPGLRRREGGAHRLRRETTTSMDREPLPVDDEFAVSDNHTQAQALAANASRGLAAGDRSSR